MNLKKSIYVVLVLVITFIGFSIAVSGCGPSVKDNSLVYSVSGRKSSEAEGVQVAKVIWKVAKKYPNITFVDVGFEFTGRVTDKYGKVEGGPMDAFGNRRPGPFQMGWMKVDNLDEVRKYECKRFCEEYGETYGRWIGNRYFGGSRTMDLDSWRKENHGTP